MYPVTPVQFSVQEIINITDGQLVRGRLNQMVSRVSTDSRNLCVGDLFLALLGEHFDGHNFLSQAVFNGAIGLVVSRVDISLKKLDVSLVIRVPDTLQAYGNLAKAHREKFDGPVIAVTGSNGKTTTKEMINSVLSVKFRVFKSEKNYNNLIGLPKSLLELPVQKSEIAVFELGTNRPGEIARLTDIVRPTVGLITNIGFSHIKFLKDLDGVAKEKCSLLKNVSVAILNNNDTKLANIQTDLTTNRVNFGTDGDVVAENIHLNCNGLASFQLVINQLGRSIPIHLPCIGYHNVFNALAAATVGYWAGLTLEQIKTGLETFRTVQMRLQSININGFRIINDAYNANPDSVQSALELFSDLHANGEKIAVLGDMLELGEQSDRLHLQIGKNIPTNLDLLITVGKLSRQIAKGAEKRISHIISCDSAKDVVPIIDRHLSDGDIILIKGSRRLKLEQIVEELQNREPKDKELKT